MGNIFSGRINPGDIDFDYDYDYDDYETTQRECLPRNAPPLVLPAGMRDPEWGYFRCCGNEIYAVAQSRNIHEDYEHDRSFGNYTKVDSYALFDDLNPHANDQEVRVWKYEPSYNTWDPVYSRHEDLYTIFHMLIHVYGKDRFLVSNATAAATSSRVCSDDSLAYDIASRWKDSVRSTYEFLGKRSPVEALAVAQSLIKWGRIDRIYAYTHTHHHRRSSLST